jgi:hypothetical protein
MPPAAPTGLSDRAYSDVEAYVLHANGVAVGSSELAPVRAQSDITVRTVNHDSTYQSVMAARQKLLAGLKPVTEGMLQHPADRDWLVWRGTYQNQAFPVLSRKSIRPPYTISVSPGAWPFRSAPTKSRRCCMTESCL